jgi:hypothetical protein
VKIILFVFMLVSLSAQPQSPWKHHVIDNSLGGADGVKLADINKDGRLDVLICEENFGPNSEGLGVVWYENPVN